MGEAREEAAAGQGVMARAGGKALGRMMVGAEAQGVAGQEA